MKDGGFGRSPLFPKAYALGNFYINLQITFRHKSLQFDTYLSLYSPFFTILHHSSPFHLLFGIGYTILIHLVSVSSQMFKFLPNFSQIYEIFQKSVDIWL